MARKPNYIAFSAVEQDGKTRWREIGAGWKNEGGDSESLTVLIDSVPLSGKIVLLPPREKDGKEGRAPEPEDAAPVL